MKDSQNSKIEFINHASILISNNEIGLLSDPWYQGDAFHKGWNLMHDLSDDEIKGVLNRTTHIWISHEHPDHFSVMFFIKFGDLIKEKGIEILFQETSDKRVEGFLNSKNFKLQILKQNKWIKISDEFSIFNFKDGFYDSGLCADIAGKKFLNLNDCEIKTPSRCKQVLKLVGECDFLISQFSYAAWKGGKNNIQWRKNAAREKLETLRLQADFFKPKVLIPFASFVYFSNESNFYLNDESNTVKDVIEFFQNNSNLSVLVMKPFQVIETDNYYKFSNDKALKFWDDASKKINKVEKKKFEIIKLDELNKSFEIYKERVFKNNSRILIRLISILSPIRAFKPIKILLSDQNIVLNFDLFSEKLNITQKEPDVSMSSESLDFILKNTFGFDTLTVNACFEETKKGGFSKMTKTMAIENLNNIGISVNLSTFLRVDIILLFISRLFAVNKKINNAT